MCSDCYSGRDGRNEENIVRNAIEKSAKSPKKNPRNVRIILSRQTIRLVFSKQTIFTFNYDAEKTASKL